MPLAWTFLVLSKQRDADHESASDCRRAVLLGFRGGLIYFAISGTGHEYDLKLVLPIDTRKMPKLGPPPEIVSQVPDDSANPIVDGRSRPET